MKQEGINSRNSCQPLSDTVCLYIVPMLLVALFAYTGAAKLLDHDLFVYQLTRSRIPLAVSRSISYTLPVAELLLAAGLCWQRTRIIALCCSSFFMLAFVGYVALVLSGKQIPCSCGGVIAAMSWTGHLYFNSAFFLLSVVTWYYHKSLRTYRE